MAFTTVIYRHANYSKRAKFYKTLAHSLRVKTSEFKPNEWVEELQDRNLIFDEKHPDGLRLDSIPFLNRINYINSFLSDEFDDAEATKEDKAKANGGKLPSIKAMAEGIGMDRGTFSKHKKTWELQQSDVSV